MVCHQFLVNVGCRAFMCALQCMSRALAAAVIGFQTCFRDSGLVVPRVSYVLVFLLPNSVLTMCHPLVFPRLPAALLCCAACLVFASSDWSAAHAARGGVACAWGFNLLHGVTLQGQRARFRQLGICGIQKYGYGSKSNQQGTAGFRHFRPSISQTNPFTDV